MSNQAQPSETYLIRLRLTAKGLDESTNRSYPDVMQWLEDHWTHEESGTVQVYVTPGEDDLLMLVSQTDEASVTRFVLLLRSTGDYQVSSYRLLTRNEAGLAEDFTCGVRH